MISYSLVHHLVPYQHRILAGAFIKMVSSDWTVESTNVKLSKATYCIRLILTLWATTYIQNGQSFFFFFLRL